MQYLRKEKKKRFSLRQGVLTYEWSHQKATECGGGWSHQKDSILVSGKRQWPSDWEFVMESEK